MMVPRKQQNLQLELIDTLWNVNDRKIVNNNNWN